MLGGTAAAEVHQYLYHELAHCYLFGRFGQAYDQMPPWYVEGTAAWIQEQLGGGDGTVSSFWRRYLDSPTWSLYQRVYTGLGFYAHLAETGTNVWPVIGPAGGVYPVLLEPP